MTGNRLSFAASAHAALAAVVLSAGLFAQGSVSFRYFYDGNHQLYRVLDSSGNLIEYDYDPAGNPTQIKRSTVSPTALAIFNIVPLLGTAGQTVTIYGQNFDSVSSGDTVKINGVNATVVSATSTTLVVIAPASVTTGPITVTVGGVNVSSGTLNFTVPPAPTITSITPSVGYPGQTLTDVAVQGTNLTGATLTLGDQGAPTSVVVTGGTQATFSLTLGPYPGVYALVAETTNGISSTMPAAGNSIQILNPPGGNFSSELLSVFNAYVPPGTDPGVPTGSNQADEQLSVFNAYVFPGTAPGVPAGSNEAFQLFSVQNNCTTCPQEALRLLIKPAADVGLGASASIARTELSAGTPDAPLIAGQTVQIDIGSTQPFTQFLEFDVDGVALASSSNGSLTIPFTVPHGPSSLELQALGHTDSGVQNESEPQRVAVIADPGRSIGERVEDATGKPVSGVVVTWQANGLSADYFAYNQPLFAMPDLSGRQPARSTFISALNFSNPLQVFGKDPIGVGLGENYAARFHGTILTETPGSYGFLLRVHTGAKLSIDGQTVAEATATGESAEASGTATLAKGSHSIEVTYYESGGASTLQLFWTMPGGQEQIVSPLALLTDPPPAPAVITGADGRFVLHVPAALEGVQVKLAAGQGSVVLDPGVNQ